MSFVQMHTWPFRYDFAVEETPLGTGGGIRLALEKCRSERVFVLNGDTFFPLALDAMPFDGPVTVALKPMKAFSRYGAVTVIPSEASASFAIQAFKEKAYCDSSTPGYTLSTVHNCIWRPFLSASPLRRRYWSPWRRPVRSKAGLRRPISSILAFPRITTRRSGRFPPGLPCKKHRHRCWQALQRHCSWTVTVFSTATWKART